MPDLLNLFSDLIRYETMLSGALDARLRHECGLPLSRFEALQVMKRRSPCRVSDIADVLAIGWSGASKMVDKLEDNGFCRRQPNPQDGRSSLIELTVSGRHTVAKGEQVLNDELAERLAEKLSPNALKMLGDTLDRLRRTETQVDDTTKNVS